MNSATLKLYLPFGDPRRLRTAEISNWSGKSIASPRTDFDELLAREELGQAGVYLLLGTNPDTGRPAVYVGEAEVLGKRLKQHRDKDFWNQVVVFFSKDDNLTRAHIKFLEGRLIERARAMTRTEVVNDVPSGARLPESDRADMEVFFSKIEQLLPVLGSDLLVPIDSGANGEGGEALLSYELRGHLARGRRTANGFVVLKGSQAVEEERPSAAERHRWVLALREELLGSGALKRAKGGLVFTRDVEFASPSAAGGVVAGGGVNGLVSWRDAEGRTLKELEGG
ncbi:MAG: GIY-YIG nuclease family protein [Polyangiales bacterium]